MSNIGGGGGGALPPPNLNIGGAGAPSAPPAPTPLCIVFQGEDPSTLN